MWICSNCSSTSCSRSVAAHFEDDLADEILTIPINPQTEEDQLVWTGNQAGKYSVKSGYHCIKRTMEQHNANQATTSFQPPPSLWTNIWKLNTPPKIRIFMWNLCQNALPTKDNLFRMKILPDPICPLCSHERETAEHLFLLCYWTRQIWDDPIKSELGGCYIMECLEGQKPGHLSR